MTPFFFCVGAVFAGILGGVIIGVVLGSMCHLMSEDFEFDQIATLMFILAVIGAIAGMWFGIVTVKNMIITVVPRVAIAAAGGGTCV